jgi:signal transduction histidine kinase
MEDTNDTKIIEPCLYFYDSIITKVNKEFIDFTGFTINELLGKSLTELGAMIRINSQILIDNIDSMYSGYIFTKSLEAREVSITLVLNKDAIEKMYSIIERPKSRLSDKLIFVEQTFIDNISCAAIYSVPELILLKANQSYLGFMDAPFNIEENSIGMPICKIITGFAGSNAEIICNTVIESHKTHNVKGFKYDRGLRGITYWDSTQIPIFENGKLKYIYQTSCNVTERVLRSEKQLEEKNAELISIIENLNGGIIVADNKGNILRTNPESRKLLNQWNKVTNLRDELKNTILFDLSGNKIALKKFPALRALRGESVKNAKMLIKDTNKEYFVEISSNPVYNSNGEISMVVSCFHDITESINNERHIKEHQNQLLISEKEKREALQEAIKLKDDFLYLITHELKTPLAVMNLASQAIQHLCKDEVTIKVSKYIKTINQNTNRQLRLVNNLLDITRISSSQVKMNMANFNIVYVIEAIVNSVQLYGEKKNVNLKFITDLEVMNIYFDEEKIERILLNLLSNALKFTESDKSITVRLSIKKNKKENMISISVEDEGIGIPQDKQKFIFERFGQANSTLSRQAEGTGLGLYLVKLLVIVLGGTISLKSQVGKGSTFTVLLPIIESINTYDIDSCNEVNGNSMISNNNVIQTAKIEFSDIYF